jgi:hypothetical protein
MVDKVTVTQTRTEKTWAYEGHWAGRQDMKSYICVTKEFFNQPHKIDRSIVRHVPSGLELATTRHFHLTTQDDAREGYGTLDFGKNLWEPEWEVSLRVSSTYNGREEMARLSKEKNVSYVDLLHQSRSTHGTTITVENIIPSAQSTSIPWSPFNIDILMNLILVSADINGFRDCAPPLPDRVIFKPKNLSEYSFVLNNLVPKV